MTLFVCGVLFGFLLFVALLVFNLYLGYRWLCRLAKDLVEPFKESFEDLEQTMTAMCTDADIPLPKKELPANELDLKELERMFTLPDRRQPWKYQR